MLRLNPVPVGIAQFKSEMIYDYLSASDSDADQWKRICLFPGELAPLRDPPRRTSLRGRMALFPLRFVLTCKTSRPCRRIAETPENVKILGLQRIDLSSVEIQP